MGGGFIQHIPGPPESVFPTSFRVMLGRLALRSHTALLAQLMFSLLQRPLSRDRNQRRRENISSSSTLSKGQEREGASWWPGCCDQDGIPLSSAVLWASRMGGKSLEQTCQRHRAFTLPEGTAGGSRRRSLQPPGPRGIHAGPTSDSKVYRHLKRFLN